MTTLDKGNQDHLKVQATLWSKFELTPRQREVAKLMCDGFSNKQIASELFITEKSVKYHVTNILYACKVTRRKELIQLVDKVCKK